jgi:hypothetical protein
MKKGGEIKMGKRKLNKILVLLFICFNVRLVFGQEELKGPRIKLEEVEIILYDDNGKEIKRIFTSGDEKETVLEELRPKIREKVLKKLGFSSDEIKDQTLLRNKLINDPVFADKYGKEYDKLCKTKALGIKRLKFIDEKGKVIKEISLLEETKIEEVGNNERYKNLGIKKIKKRISKNAVVSKNKKFAVIVSNESENGAIYEDGREELFYEPAVVAGEITVFDREGRILLKKRMPHRWIGLKPLISDDGGVIVIYTESDEPLPEGRDMIYVFNRNGDEILSFPTEEEYNSGYDADDQPEPRQMSPNGRYLAIEVDKDIPDKRPPIIHLIRFYDLHRKTFYEFEKEYYVYNITNDGIAKVSECNAEGSIVGSPIIEIDLKKYLGEGE